jgi:hypothetical protein
MNELEKRVANSTQNVENEIDADIFVMKINSAYADIETLKNQRDEYIRKINENFEQKKASIDKEIEYNQSLLLPFVAKTIENGKKKSLKLPHGTVGFRKGIKIEKNDEELFKFVEKEELPFIVTKKSVNWAEMKKNLVFSDGKAVTKDGQVVPGIIATETNDFYVRGDKNGTPKTE